MTREEAIKHGQEQLGVFGGEHREFIELAIKALEQEPTDKIFTKADIDAIVKAINKGWELRVNEVLDKIRAEILKEMLSHSGTGEEVIQAYVDGLKKGLDFIDKYKAKSGE